MSKRKRLLFLQLPQLDNVVRGAHENVGLAALYLQHAAERAGEDRHYEPLGCGPEADRLDDRHLAELILDLAPDVIAATLYLWNVERTLHVLHAVRRRLPRLRIVVGGPEVAPRHPFLFRGGLADVAVTGEGEAVFPRILAALRGHGSARFRSTAWRCRGRYAWGVRPSPTEDLERSLPPPDHALLRPDEHGMAYLETGRGCPLSCAFCCYNQRRRTLTCLDAPSVLERIRVLRGRGAREIRFIDPTFNANPHINDILRGIAAKNRDRRLRFFAELRAETVTEEQADLLEAANVTDIEIGVQSRNRQVLRAIRRPTDLQRLDRGWERLSRRGRRLTLDVMCGLPHQTMRDIRQSVTWAAGVRHATVQFLHALLLPGTGLRDTRRAEGLIAQERPPYRVLRTPLLSEDDLRSADDIVRVITGRTLDAPTQRFVGTTLPDLFPERVAITAAGALPPAIPGMEVRRAVALRGSPLVSNRQRIARFVRQAIREEPHALWQFVLELADEEPLDLLDAVIAAIRALPPHILDNQTIGALPGAIASRRLFIRLRRSRRYDPVWRQAAEDLLSASFF